MHPCCLVMSSPRFLEFLWLRHPVHVTLCQITARPLCDLLPLSQLAILFDDFERPHCRLISVSSSLHNMTSSPHGRVPFQAVPSSYSPAILDAMSPCQALDTSPFASTSPCHSVTPLTCRPPAKGKKTSLVCMSMFRLLDETCTTGTVAAWRGSALR